MVAIWLPTNNQFFRIMTKYYLIYSENRRQNVHKDSNSVNYLKYGQGEHECKMFASYAEARAFLDSCRKKGDLKEFSIYASQLTKIDY